jgi:hypothetical protein
LEGFRHKERHPGLEGTGDSRAQERLLEVPELLSEIETVIKPVEEANVAEQVAMARVRDRVDPDNWAAFVKLISGEDTDKVAREYNKKTSALLRMKYRYLEMFDEELDKARQELKQ